MPLCGFVHCPFSVSPCYVKLYGHKLVVYIIDVLHTLCVGLCLNLCLKVIKNQLLVLTLCNFV